MTINIEAFLTRTTTRKEAENIAAIETKALGRQVWILWAKGYFFVVQVPLARKLALSGKFDYVA